MYLLFGQNMIEVAACYIIKVLGFEAIFYFCHLLFEMPLPDF